MEFDWSSWYKIPGNVIEPIDKSRTDSRGKSHIREYNKAKKAIGKAGC